MINIKIINQTYGLITFKATLPEVSAKKQHHQNKDLQQCPLMCVGEIPTKKQDKIFINFISLLQMSIRHPQAAIE